MQKLQMSIHVILIFAIFTARRVRIAWTMPWQDVCPSVCPSHADIL